MQMRPAVEHYVVLAIDAVRKLSLQQTLSKGILALYNVCQKSQCR